MLLLTSYHPSSESRGRFRRHIVAVAPPQCWGYFPGRFCLKTLDFAPPNQNPVSTPVLNETLSQLMELFFLSPKLIACIFPDNAE